MPSRDRRDEAIRWHVRLSGETASGSDWAEFNDWLDADPANAAAYDQVALDDARLSQIVEQGRARNDNQARPRPLSRSGLVAAIAASVAITTLAGGAFWSAHGLKRFQTQPGETREIELADGSQMVLNGDTRVVVDPRTGRFARLERGEALFVVAHDAAHPFVVEASGAVLKDLGTRFDVRQAGETLDVSVAEGAVAYNPDGEALTIRAGQRLSRASRKAALVLKPFPREAVAGWRQRKLVYQDATLQEVAVDLSRLLGKDVQVSPELAGRRFTGVIRVDPDRALFLRRLEGLLGVHTEQNEAGWRLRP